MFRRHRHMDDRFVDRWQAGRALGAKLEPLVAEVPPAERLVLGLARGGVVVAAEVAATLGAPLDAVVVRKIGSPYQPELAIGAVGPAGARVYNRELVAELGIGEASLTALTERTEQARESLDRELRDGRPLPELVGRLAILVDDGLATGASMRAALAYARPVAASVLVAVPVAAPDVIARLAAHGITSIALIEPGGFDAVGSWYIRFDEISSAEVQELLRSAIAPDH